MATPSPIPVLCRRSRSISRSSTSACGTDTAGESSSASFFSAASLFGICEPSASTMMRSIVRMSQSRMGASVPGSALGFRHALLGSLLHYFCGALHARRVDFEIRNAGGGVLAHALSALGFGFGGAMLAADLALEFAEHDVDRSVHVVRRFFGFEMFATARDANLRHL